MRSLGNSPSEMPAQDDVTSPHQGQALGSCGSPQKGLEFLVRGAKASLALAAECGRAGEDLRIKWWKC